MLTNVWFAYNPASQALGFLVPKNSRMCSVLSHFFISDSTCLFPVLAPIGSKVGYFITSRFCVDFSEIVSAAFLSVWFSCHLTTTDNLNLLVGLREQLVQYSFHERVVIKMTTTRDYTPYHLLCQVTVDS